MGTYKLVALDMDGTLLTEEKTISKANKEAIFAALDKGVTVIFSTGRGVQSITPYAEELKLETPLVAVNGSEVWSAPHKLHKRTLFQADVIRRLHALALKHDSWYWAYAVDGLFNRDQWTDDLDGQQWLKFGYYTEEEDKLKAIRSEVEKWDLFEVTNSHVCNIELNPKGISKASGVEEVCKMIGADMSQVIAMGDSQNDIAMIRSAGLGVAMGNAQEEVKRIADYVTATNEEDGVARVIEQFVLNA
ncbi:HAD-superfamily hydrolase [Paenibacillus larvae subsp. larvae]|uniref:Phosphoglycolate phosphatase n=2 Tax=Paenibacillus larvae TaxID=1464 RepID=A0A1V0URG5_9BACL|nr:Cof-type HAD-IIB family hydrolase [Paenibacillus larvae]AQT84251.1 phosphoglycolate phosphatase, TA0175-type [Paenibacillus larvae subsp. pulvifaciens]AQZ46228.1 phosphoglycolate phosphatase [Paenibacillus larvae subsp. pulvifaciens]ARF67562.1 phosphoglycolate phosphatase [Paenibacillus larvae subsp. pulvifaciens]AVF27900.1 HAD-superfamily hydrolase [Paenibacillus larvae subsp. larvae]AVF32402.1 HAD-superfamily hydrolase [Paenibacillus larvae subsp. larvae]